MLQTHTCVFFEVMEDIGKEKRKEKRKDDDEAKTGNKPKYEKKITLSLVTLTRSPSPPRPRPPRRHPLNLAPRSPRQTRRRSDRAACDRSRA